MKKIIDEKIEELSKIYSIQESTFEEYKKSALLTVTAGKRPSEDKTLIIVGGQAGAGKSRLVPVAKQELSNNAVIVDFDELRALHPHYKEVNENYPEITHGILHKDTERVKNEVLKTLIDQNYNVIYEGALRNTQGFVDFAKDFKNNDYKVKMYVMAVPKLESYGSTFVRYAMALLTDAEPRWVEKWAHDASYEGVKRTIEALTKEGLIDDANVFVREPERPRRIYTTKGHEHRDAIAAIEYGRESGRKKAINDFSTKYKTVKDILQEKKPELVDKLESWANLYNEEVEYFKELSKGCEYDD